MLCRIFCLFSIDVSCLRSLLPLNMVNYPDYYVPRTNPCIRINIRNAEEAV